MLSKLLNVSRSNIANLPQVRLQLVRDGKEISQNVISKRWSGHNTMEITPSNITWKRFKDTFHFYTLISIVPVIVITTIINIRANPELTEIPEGYEPRHWEYYRHPIARWMAKNLYQPMELEHELHISCQDNNSQTLITKAILREADSMMKFYQDHRSNHFRPYYAESFRIGRDNLNWGVNFTTTNENIHYERAFQEPIVPIEGYPADWDHKD